MEDRVTGVPAETTCGAKEGDQKLQGFCAHIGDVQVVCVLCYSASGERKRT